MMGNIGSGKIEPAVFLGLPSGENFGWGIYSCRYPTLV